MENVRDHFSVVTLSSVEQFETAAEAARCGFGGGRIYDLLALKCAIKSGVECVYALNLPGSMRLATPEIRERLEVVS